MFSPVGLDLFDDHFMHFLFDLFALAPDQDDSLFHLVDHVRDIWHF